MHTVFIPIQVQMFIFYKWFLRCLNESSIYLNPGIFSNGHLDGQGQGRVASASTSIYGLEDINKLQALLSDEMLQEVQWIGHRQSVVAITKGKCIVGRIPTEIYAKNTIIVF